MYTHFEGGLQIEYSCSYYTLTLSLCVCVRVSVSLHMHTDTRTLTHTQMYTYTGQVERLHHKIKDVTGIESVVL